MRDRKKNNSSLNKMEVYFSLCKRSMKGCPGLIGQFSKDRDPGSVSIAWPSSPRGFTSKVAAYPYSNKPEEGDS